MDALSILVDLAVPQPSSQTPVNGSWDTSLCRVESGGALAQRGFAVSSVHSNCRSQPIGGAARLASWPGQSWKSFARSGGGSGTRR